MSEIKKVEEELTNTSTKIDDKLKAPNRFHKEIGRIATNQKNVYFNYSWNYRFSIYPSKEMIFTDILWHILGGAERERNKQGKPFYLNLWENLDTIDLIQSEQFAHWERKAGRIQYEFRTRISSNKGKYSIFYCINSSGYNTGPFNREFHRKQVKKELNILTNP
jgi:hypothetical protein